MVLVAALFFVPVVGAWLLHKNIDLWRPDSTVNYGKLLTPVRALPGVELARRERGVLRREDFVGKWTLVYIHDTACDAGCRENLYKVRQVRLAQGGEKERVQRLWLVLGPPDAPELAEVLEGHDGMLVAGGQGADFDAFLQAFSAQGAEVAAGQIFIVDPLGNVMMRYAQDAEPKGIVKDLERLLKLSLIG